MRIVTCAGAVALAAALSAVACSFPDDSSDQVYVVVFQSDSLVSRGVLGDGEEDFVVAKTYQLVGSPDTGNVDDVELHNVQYVWTSDNDNVISVLGESFGAATVQGESPGTETIRARVVNFESAAEGTTSIRVSGLFALDSVGPNTVRFGETLRFSGVRVGLVFAASLGAADLIPDGFSFQGNPNGVGQIDFWVPPPASTDNVFFIGPGFFGFTPNVVTVLPYDLYEPNDSDIVDIDVNGPGGPREFQGFPTLFFNPALFYEPPVNPWAEEWFRFTRADTTGAVTFIANSKVFTDTAFIYLSDSIAYTGGGFIQAPGNFLLSSDFVQCAGDVIITNADRGLTTIFAWRNLPQATVHMFLASASSGGYELMVVNGYFTVDRRIGPDRFEEDDLWCVWSDLTFNTSTDSTSSQRKHVVVGFPFSWFDSTLTIDNPGDMDWIRFRVRPAALGVDTMTVIRTKSLPLPGAGFDASNINLQVRRVSDFALMGAAAAPGSTEALTLLLAPGDYYLGVIDVTQQATKYSVCIIKGTSGANCLPPGLAAAPPLPTAPEVLRQPRRVPADAPARPAARSPLLRP